MTFRPAVLFDLDGTLTDSAPGILNCLRKVLGQLHLTYDQPLEAFIGPPVEQWCEAILPDGSEEARKHLADTYRAAYDREGWCDNSVYAGIPEALGALKQQGIRLYVCTSKNERFAKRIVSHFGLDPYFDQVYGDLPDSDHAKSTLLARLLRSEQLSAECVTLVGDRKYDVAAGRANGVRVLGALWGYGTAEELTAAGAEALCPTPHDVPDAVLALPKC